MKQEIITGKRFFQGIILKGKDIDAFIACVKKELDVYINNVYELEDLVEFNSCSSVSITIIDKERYNDEKYFEHFNGEEDVIMDNDLLLVLSDYDYLITFGSAFSKKHWTKKQYIKHFKKIYGKYLPEDFDYENKMGSLECERFIRI